MLPGDSSMRILARIQTRMAREGDTEDVQEGNKLIATLLPIPHFRLGPCVEVRLGAVRLDIGQANPWSRTLCTGQPLANSPIRA